MTERQTPRRQDAKPQGIDRRRSEEHTSELQSHSDIVCRLPLEKKNSHHVVEGHDGEGGQLDEPRRPRRHQDPGPATVIDVLEAATAGWLAVRSAGRSLSIPLVR